MARADASAPARIRGRGWILTGLMMTMALSAIDTTIVSTAIPQVVGDLGGFALFSWVFSIYLLTQTVTIPIYGKLADLYGRKPVLLVGVLIFLLGSGLCACAQNMPELICFRAVQGLGAGSIPATVNTVAGDLYTLRERGRVQGLLSSVWGVSAIIGPTLGGSFAEYSSWRWIFVINLPVGAIAFTVIARYLREHVVPARHTIDYLGSAGLLVAAGGFIFWLLQGGVAWSWLSWPSVLVVAAAITVAAATVITERRAAEPMMPGWIWRVRALAGANLATLGLGLLTIGPSTFLPTYGQEVLGLGPVVAGFVLATMSFTWPISSSLAGRLYMRIGFRDTGLIGAVLAVAATASFAFVPDGGPVWQLVAISMGCGAAFGMLSTSMVVGAQSTTTWSRRGVVTGATMFSRYLGQSLGAAIFGAISNATLAGRLRAAPAGLRGRLPHDVNAISGVLAHGGALSGHARAYLRSAIFAATHNVYLGLAAIAVLASLVLAVFTPRRFPPPEPEPQPAQSTCTGERR